MSKLAKALTAAAGNAGESLYVEDVFSTYLYTGNSGSGSTQSNGLDLSGEGGLVWVKIRDSSTQHLLFDTERGGTNYLTSAGTAAASTGTDGISFLSNGWSTAPNGVYDLNNLGANYTSWSFRKAEKFFDVVTWTGDGVAGRTVAHNLGSVPGCIIVKRTDSANGWAVYHRAMDATAPEDWMMRLNATDARFDLTPSRWNDTAPTSTDFTLSDNDEVNGSGATYVAYLFASDAGGFGDDGSESIIKCGSFTGTGQVDLGFEPQFLLYKPYTQIYDWKIADNMRRLDAASSSVLELEPNSSDAEAGGAEIKINATGFYNWTFGGSYPCIYIAIRRPMKTPTAGTEVFSPVLETVADGTGTKLTTSFPIDLQVINYTPGTTSNSGFLDRLRGISTTTTESGQRLVSSATSAEASATVTRYWDNTGFQVSSAYNNTRTIYWNFKRATGFFDVVCYSGDAVSGRAVPHNLGVKPELVIVKRRNDVTNWPVMADVQTTTCRTLFLDTTNSGSAASYSGNTWQTAPTASNFYVSSFGSVNASGGTYVAYLFATLAGVSKVGSYTGTGSPITVDCGFTSGARFIMIKRTDAAAGWIVFDSARGIVAGEDPYLYINTSDAESSTDAIDPDSSGFIVNPAGGALNTSGGTYIFLAIA